MPRRRRWSLELVHDAAREQDDLLTRQQLLALGVPDSGIQHRARPDGPWKRLLPAVYLLRGGRPTHRQRLRAALLHAGPTGVLTGAAALEWRGLQAQDPSGRIHVLVAHACHRRSVGFVRVERTYRQDRAVVRGLPCTSTARAVVDLGRSPLLPDAAVALVAHVLQRGACPLVDLVAEVEAAARSRTATVRRAVEEGRAGTRSVAEARARRLLRAAGAPEPRWNVDLITIEGEFVARPDAYWADRAVALEVDSQEWHLAPDDWARTLARHSEMASHGILVVHVTPRQLLREPAVALAALRRALAVGGATSLRAVDPSA